MKKTKKALASLAIAGMVLSMAPASIFAADTDTRLAGADRYLTSIAIAEKAYDSANTAVVAAGNPNNLVDALAAAPLAAQEDAPIYLTDKADMNNDVVKSLANLGVKNVIVVGAAANKAVVDELKAAGLAVEEVKGANRVETAAAINAKLTAPAGTIVVGYNGVADAMSVASYAAANNYAIVVANQNGTVAAGTDADFIIGGPTLVKDIAGAERIFGADRFETNKKVIAELDFDFAKVYVGNGLTLADALVGSVLAAQTNSPIALTDGKTVKADIASNLTDDSVVVALGGTGVVSNAVLNAVVNPPTSTPTGEFKVESVAAVAANSIKVKFSKAPADASKVTFEVKQGQSASATAVNVTWNDAEATLSKSSNFVNGAYTVTIKEDAKDLGSKQVTFTEQRVAKIEITSTKLGVVTSTSTSATAQIQTGYATYKISDQYGTDITNSALANNVNFNCGVAKSIEAKKGLLKLVAADNLNLLGFAGGIVITANDTTTGVSTTATLAATSQIGTLSDIKLNKLVSADGTEKELTASNLTDVFYIDYTATDISGNTTTNYELVRQGLILTEIDSIKDRLTTSNPNVIVKVVKDPKDSSKALIEVTTNDKEITVDTPVIITAMTWTGKTSQLEQTLKKQAEIAKITLFAPDEAVASEDTVVVPFVAYDQNGKQITKFNELKTLDNRVTLTNADFKENIDGTARIEFEAPSVTSNTSVPYVITATVSKTGYYSSVTLNVQKSAIADSLELDTTVLIPLMQVSAVSGIEDTIQTIDFGWDEGGLAVKDQYGRAMDMTTAEKYDNYRVRAVSGNDKILEVVNEKDSSFPGLGDTTLDKDDNPNTNGILSSGRTNLQLKAVSVGSTSVSFILEREVAVDDKGTTAWKEVDSVAQTLTVVADTDIKGYTIDKVSKHLYAANGVLGIAVEDGTTPNGRVAAYNAGPKVYGTTSTGAKVLLRGEPIIGASLRSNAYFTVYGITTSSAVAYDKVKVVADRLPDDWTEGSTVLDVVIKGADNKVYTVNTELKSTKATPVAQNLLFDAKTHMAGVSYDKDVLTIDLNQVEGKDIANVLGTTLARFTADAKANSGKIHFAAVDQYGKKGIVPQFVLVDKKVANADFSVASNGTLTTDKLADKDEFTVSAISGGLIKTVTIKIVAK